MREGMATGQQKDCKAGRNRQGWCSVLQPLSRKACSLTRHGADSTLGRRIYQVFSITARPSQTPTMRGKLGLAPCPRLNTSKAPSPRLRMAPFHSPSKCVWTSTNGREKPWESATSVKGNLPNGDAGRSAPQASDPLQAIQTALINARASQPPSVQPAGLGPPETANGYRTDRTIRFKNESLGSNTIRMSPNTSARREIPPSAGMRSKLGGLSLRFWSSNQNPDLPGVIRALVRENVYDTVSGKFILIPAGSTLVGIYNSHVGYGQKALQAVWRRVIFPDGSSLSLGGFEGDNGEGAAGFRDQVDSHWGRVYFRGLAYVPICCGNRD